MSKRGDVRPLSSNQAREVHQWAVKVLSAKAAKRTEVRGALIAATSLHTGLRVSEVQQLKWGDFSAGANQTRGLAEVLVRRGKGGKRRRVMISKAILDLTSAWRNRCSVISPDSLLFESPSGGLLSVRTLQRDVAQVFESCKIEGHSVHDLRHTYATHLYVQIQDTRYIMQQLGHDRVETTMRYIASLASYVKDALENMYGIGVATAKIINKIGV